jgi:hypothetical protein
MREPLSLTQIESVQKAALASCDAQDGVTDGVIENPLSCRFNPAVLHLLPGQAAVVSRIYAGSRLAPGFQLALGNELDQ